MFFLIIFVLFSSANIWAFLNKIHLLKKQKDRWSLAFCETDQNEMSLWLKQKQISANWLRKINLIQGENFSYPNDRYLFLF